MGGSPTENKLAHKMTLLVLLHKSRDNKQCYNIVAEEWRIQTALDFKLNFEVR